MASHDPIVETRNGRLLGAVEGDGLAFRGVPFARVEPGAGRWRPAQRPAPWGGVRAALRPRVLAPQNEGSVARFLGMPELPASEDCLELQLWTPAADAASRPVLVWIHGGGFTTGSSALPVFDGAKLAAEGDVVVVAVNYRVGALGFLQLPGEDACANVGLLDQIAALEWVRDEIAAFGGDPSRVTLAGQSAGAMCAATLLAVPRARGLFHRAVLQSGAARHVHAQETAARVADVFCEQAGCAPGDVDALRRVPVDALLAAQAATQARLVTELAHPAFQPAVDATLLPQLPEHALAAGRGAAVPLLVGTNADEWRFYGLRDPKLATLDEAALLRRMQRALPGADACGAELAERAVSLYREVLGSAAHPRDLWFAISTDRWFRHPAARLAEQLCGAVPVHAYLFDWPSPVLGGGLGACHALEVPFVFGSFDRSEVARFVGEGAAVERLSRRMRGAWLAFVRGEAPAQPELPCWRTYDPARRATLVLGADCRIVDAPGERERVFWDEVA